jgi:UDP-N-acetylglucosamine 4-epimerase
VSQFEAVINQLKQEPKKWLITGAAGFIGSNLIHKLLGAGQEVIALDNFSTGFKSNIDEVSRNFDADTLAKFKFIEGDISNAKTCTEAMSGVDYVLHQGALGSVPRSINDPINSHNSNVTGFINMLVAAKDAGVKSFVYASSSSVYGDHPALPKVEENIGSPLSPYAATKYFNEVYANVFAQTYQMSLAGLRYFNVFGRRQSPEGAYAAVMPIWVKAMIKNEELFINGDGETSRDFCYIDNVIQANILAAINCVKNESRVYNIGVGDRTTLSELFNFLKESLASECDINYDREPTVREFRAGDVRHSLASIEKAQADLGYEPTHRVREGIQETIKWYVESLGNS